ncbi:MAG: response regulator, partial [Deltaproteobacteria bacterium]|nr:response regulator [Deltaproteobacteria bacterium]
RVESVNDALTEMTGFPASEMVGKKVVDLVTIPEKSKPLSARNFELTLQGRGEIMRLELVRADGRPLIVETHPQLVTLPGGRQVVQSVLRDLTGRLEAEERERKLQLELLDARRMEGLGRLAGGIAHDFRNLLTPVLSNARMLREHSLTQEGRELVQEIEVASQRASNLVAQLLAFARRQMLEVRVLDLNDAVRDLEPMLRRLIREDISLKVSFAPVLQAVRADRGQLGQVLVNLVANARDAMPKGGALTIETLDAHLDDEYAAQHPGVKPGRYSTLVVTDTGEGMSEQVRQHVFEPFFTTKGAQEGTGLGLATVHGIVKQSGGSIHVYSEPGHGTTFRIYLPAVDELPEPKQEVKRALPRAVRSATVLVVDDEDLVRGVVLRILRGAGYSVLEASDGGEAVEVAKARNEPIDLLITDVVMPVLAGRELATAIEGHHKAVRVLYVSGYTEHGVVHGGELDPEIDFLVKPFTPEALLNKVDEILRRP